MDGMPAVLFDSDRRITLTERPRPGRHQDQVVVDVDLCGICGSDLHAAQLPQVYRGGFVMGHEPSGTVSWVGGAVEGWEVGQRVAINPIGNVDGTCAQCRAGRPNFCYHATMETGLGMQMDGALAPQMAAYPGNLRAVPDGMGRTAAAWVEPTATALRGVRRAGDVTGRRVLVTGGGPIGQLTVRIARHAGASHVVLVEPAEERRSFGPASGAHAVLSPDEARDAVEELQADVVIEASGSGSATGLGLDALRPGGMLVVVGSSAVSSLDSTTVLLKEITVRGSFTYADEFDETLTLLAERQIVVDDLTSTIAPLEDALAAFDSLRSASTMKVLIAPGQ